MIRSFKSQATEDLFTTGRSRKLPTDIHRSGLRKLEQLNMATTLSDLKGVGNKLEELSNGRKALRVNDRFRLVFRWVDGDAYDVEIVDYHR